MPGKGEERRHAKEPTIDPYRAFVFPNRMRECRQRQGYARLLHFAADIRDIPYIRLSKIERGEVFARPEELRRIAEMLRISPSDLLIDIDEPTFDIARWTESFGGSESNVGDARFAVLLAAAIRARRAGDPRLTIASIERDFGLPQVNLSRLENALKPLDRWNAATRSAIYALFGVANEDELRGEIDRLHHAGDLDDFVDIIATPQSRHERSRARIAEITAALAQEDGDPPAPVAITRPAQPHSQAAAMAIRLAPLHGTPLANGLISFEATGEKIEAPHLAGPRAFGLRMCRATLGAGLPGQAKLIVDPDRDPVPGGLAVLKEEAGWRVLSVGSDRTGRMIGYSINPEMEVPLDTCDPNDLAAIVSAIFA